MSTYTEDNFNTDEGKDLFRVLDSISTNIQSIFSTLSEKVDISAYAKNQTIVGLLELVNNIKTIELEKPES